MGDNVVMSALNILKDVPLKVYICDLTHDTVVLVSDTIPINVGFIGAYAKKTHGDAIDTALFKYPQAVIEAIKANPPDVIALSNYSWNSRLSERIARFAKECNPKVVTVQGGTNFPHTEQQQLEFLRSRPSTDVYVELESEMAFAGLISKILACKDSRETIFESLIPGCVFIEPSTRHKSSPVLRRGELLPRFDNLDDIPSPYLTGTLDHFFDGRLTPFIETNRGCPFLCTFCHTGAEYFNKTKMFSFERVAEEINYIAPRVADLGIVNLHLADTNFGMYQRDREICEALLRSQETFGWPRQIMATTGKNNKARVIDITKIMGTVFSVNMSVQSMDQKVLSNIKRDNIRIEDYTKVTQHLNEVGRATKAELISGLPGETRESYVRGVKQVMESGASNIGSYTLMLLHGTEFKEPEYRTKFAIEGKYRIVPLDFGEYEGEKVFDTEEVCIATNTMTFDDYVWIRGLCLFVEVMHNNRPFDELIRYGIGCGLTRFEIITRAYDEIKNSPAQVREIVDAFMDETRRELWDSDEELMAWFERDENYARLVRGEVGGNLIYKYKAMSLAFHSDEWVEFLSSIIRQLVQEIRPQLDATKQLERELGLLVTYVKNKLAGILNCEGDEEPRSMESGFDIKKWVKSPEGSSLESFALTNSLTYTFEYSPDQFVARRDYFKRYGTDVNALSKIVTRVSNVESLFRTIHVKSSEGTALVTDYEQKDEFTRYTLFN